MSFVRRKEDRESFVSPNFKGGSGSLKGLRILNGPDEMLGKGRVFSVNTLSKFDEIGWHVHEGDAEIYLVLSGEGQYSDNGNIVTMKEGDVSMVRSGEGHSMINLKDEPLVLLALVLYE